MLAILNYLQDLKREISNIKWTCWNEMTTVFVSNKWIGKQIEEASIEESIACKMHIIHLEHLDCPAIIINCGWNSLFKTKLK